MLTCWKAEINQT